MFDKLVRTVNERTTMEFEKFEPFKASTFEKRSEFEDGKP